jgi:hypothetical protein
LNRVCETKRFTLHITSGAVKKRRGEEKLSLLREWALCDALCFAPAFHDGLEWIDVSRNSIGQLNDVLLVEVIGLCSRDRLCSENISCESLEIAGGE